MNFNDKNTILNKPSRKVLWIVCIVISLVGAILLIGIPGALLLGLVDLILRMTGTGAVLLTGDNVWPAVIMISLLWPFWLLPVSSWMQRKFPQVGGFLHWFLIVLISLIITVITLLIWNATQAS